MSMRVSLDDIQLVTNQAQLDALLEASKADDEAALVLRGWTIVNNGRLSMVCPRRRLFKYHLNLVREADPLRRDFARSFGKSLHAVVADISRGAPPDEAVSYFADATDQALLAAKDSDDINKMFAKADQWKSWLAKAAPVIQTKLAMDTYGAPTSYTKVETPVAIVFPQHRVIVMTVPDAIGTWNDGSWCYEAKTVGASRSLVETARQHHRSLQFTIQSLATYLMVRDSGGEMPPYMGTMYDYYVKRAVPPNPDDVKCAKLCDKCPAATLQEDSLGEDDIAAIALAHPRASAKDPMWIRKHVEEESLKVARFERRQREARLARAEWPDAIFKRDPHIVTVDDLMVRIDRDLSWAVERWRRMGSVIYGMSNYSNAKPLYLVGTDTSECYGFNPCGVSSLCNDHMLAQLGMGWSMSPEPPEGYVRREPDYVDVVAGGTWPDVAYDEWEWDEGDDDDGA